MREQPPNHFFNGLTHKVLDDSGSLSSDVQWHSASSFLLNNLSVGQHSVTVRLATASNVKFSNTEALPAPVTVMINPPTPLATLTITSPLPGASLPSGPGPVSFTVQNFTIGGPGTPHLHIYLDGGTTPNHFFNGTTNQVLDGGGAPVTNITWLSTTSFQITGLSSGSHIIRLRLADGADLELPNAAAMPPDLNIIIQAPPGSPTLTIISPAPGALPLPPGPVLVTFDIQNSPVPLSATQPRMHFYVDGDTTVYKFYDGPVVTESGSTSSGVLYQGVHTHFVHWKSGSSIQLNALASGSHQVRFVLVDQAENELHPTETTRAFTIAAGTGGAFSLQPVVGGLNFPTAMATAPDGRIFVNELVTGNIRVVTPTTTLLWQLQAAPFAALLVAHGAEEGLLGIAVDPNFSGNHYVYVYYTAPGPKNRVVRFTATTDSNGDTVATNPTPDIILDSIPAANAHNGGIIHFGPDGMLYIFVGENEIAANAQVLTSLLGKILRVNPADGSVPSDNPFFNSNPDPNAQKVYSLGHRNSFGFTFHSHTDDLWETENGDTDCDQINRIVRGGNYGWPNSPCGGDPLYIDPIITFGNGLTTPTIAPTGIVAFREDSVYPAQYHNNLLFADFKYGQLHRIELTGAQLTDFSNHTIACNCGQGGLLAVMHGLNVPGQDGYIYVSNVNGSIFRVILN